MADSQPVHLNETRLLPPPSGEGEAQTVQVNGDSLKLDALGPMVVNSDGVRLPCLLCASEATTDERRRYLGSQIGPA
jgi:hypothetical protein